MSRKVCLLAAGGVLLAVVAFLTIQVRSVAQRRFPRSPWTSHQGVPGARFRRDFATLGPFGVRSIPFRGRSPGTFMACAWCGQNTAAGLSLSGISKIPAVSFCLAALGKGRSFR